MFDPFNYTTAILSLNSKITNDESYNLQKQIIESVIKKLSIYLTFKGKQNNHLFNWIKTNRKFKYQKLPELLAENENGTDRMITEENFNIWLEVLSLSLGNKNHSYIWVFTDLTPPIIKKLFEKIPNKVIVFMFNYSYVEKFNSQKYFFYDITSSLRPNQDSTSSNNIPSIEPEYEFLFDKVFNSHYSEYTLSLMIEKKSYPIRIYNCINYTHEDTCLQCLSLLSKDSNKVEFNCFQGLICYDSLVKGTQTESKKEFNSLIEQMHMNNKCVLLRFKESNKFCFATSRFVNNGYELIMSSINSLDFFPSPLKGSIIFDWVQTMLSDPTDKKIRKRNMSSPLFYNSTLDQISYIQSLINKSPKDNTNVDNLLQTLSRIYRNNNIPQPLLLIYQFLKSKGDGLVGNIGIYTIYYLAELIEINEGTLLNTTSYLNKNLRNTRMSTKNNTISRPNTQQIGNEELSPIQRKIEVVDNGTGLPYNFNTIRNDKPILPILNGVMGENNATFRQRILSEPAMSINGILVDDEKNDLSNQINTQGTLRPRANSFKDPRCNQNPTLNINNENELNIKDLYGEQSSHPTDTIPSHESNQELVEEDDKINESSNEQEVNEDDEVYDPQNFNLSKRVKLDPTSYNEEHSDSSSKSYDDSNHLTRMIEMNQIDKGSINQENSPNSNSAQNQVDKDNQIKSSVLEDNMESNLQQGAELNNDMQNLNNSAQKIDLGDISNINNDKDNIEKETPKVDQGEAKVSIFNDKEDSTKKESANKKVKSQKNKGRPPKKNFTNSLNSPSFSSTIKNSSTLQEGNPLPADSEIAIRFTRKSAATKLKNNSFTSTAENSSQPQQGTLPSKPSAKTTKYSKRNTVGKSGNQTFSPAIKNLYQSQAEISVSDPIVDVPSQGGPAFSFSQQAKAKIKSFFQFVDTNKSKKKTNVREENAENATFNNTQSVELTSTNNALTLSVDDTLQTTITSIYSPSQHEVSHTPTKQVGRENNPLSTSQESTGIIFSDKKQGSKKSLLNNELNQGLKNYSTKKLHHDISNSFPNAAGSISQGTTSHGLTISLPYIASIRNSQPDDLQSISYNTNSRAIHLGPNSNEIPINNPELNIPVDDNLPLSSLRSRFPDQNQISEEKKKSKLKDDPTNSQNSNTPPTIKRETLSALNDPLIQRESAFSQSLNKFQGNPFIMEQNDESKDKSNIYLNQNVPMKYGNPSSNQSGNSSFTTNPNPFLRASHKINPKQVESLSINATQSSLQETFSNNNPNRTLDPFNTSTQSHTALSKRSLKLLGSTNPDFFLPGPLLDSNNVPAANSQNSTILKPPKTLPVPENAQPPSAPHLRPTALTGIEYSELHRVQNLQNNSFLNMRSKTPVMPLFPQNQLPPAMIDPSSPADEKMDIKEQKEVTTAQSDEPNKQTKKRGRKPKNIGNKKITERTEGDVNRNMQLDSGSTPGIKLEFDPRSNLNNNQAYIKPVLNTNDSNSHIAAHHKPMYASQHSTFQQSQTRAHSNYNTSQHGQMISNSKDALGNNSLQRQLINKPVQAYSHNPILNNSRTPQNERSKIYSIEALNNQQSYIIKRKILEMDNQKENINQDIRTGKKYLDTKLHALADNLVNSENNQKNNSNYNTLQTHQSSQFHSSRNTSEQPNRENNKPIREVNFNTLSLPYSSSHFSLKDIHRESIPPMDRSRMFTNDRNRFPSVSQQSTYSQSARDNELSQDTRPYQSQINQKSSQLPPIKYQYAQNPQTQSNQHHSLQSTQAPPLQNNQFQISQYGQYSSTRHIQQPSAQQSQFSSAQNFQQPSSNIRYSSNQNNQYTSQYIYSPQNQNQSNSFQPVQRATFQPIQRDSPQIYQQGFSQGLTGIRDSLNNSPNSGLNTHGYNRDILNLSSYSQQQSLSSSNYMPPVRNDSMTTSSRIEQGTQINVRRRLGANQNSNDDVDDRSSSATNLRNILN